MAKELKQYEITNLETLHAKIEELDAVIANLPGFVYWLDRNNIYQGCNINEAELFEFASRKDFIGKTNYDLLPQQAQHVDVLNQVVMENGEPFVGEETALTEEGEVIYLSKKVPLKNNAGTVIGLLGVSFDITDRKRMERELKEAKEAAEIANQTKTEFIRNMEHDIRTPLCGIMSVVTHLQSIEKSHKRKDFLNDLHIATNELLNYLDNIVEFSQINTGAVPLIKKEFNLFQVIKGIFNMESAAAKDKALDLKIEYASNVPCTVMGDRFRIHRILLNLINNAIKFTEKGSVKVTVSATLQEENTTAILHISVKDTGIGIMKKNHEMIFDKFTRCELSNKGIYKGTGLGLWIVKHFVEDLGGTLELDSAIGEGSVFRFSFPTEVIASEELIDG